MPFYPWWFILAPPSVLGFSLAFPLSSASNNRKTNEQHHQTQSAAQALRRRRIQRPRLSGWPGRRTIERRNERTDTRCVASDRCAAQEMRDEQIAHTDRDCLRERYETE